MEADSEPIVRGKRISDLKVADLKRELKKHSLPKDGKKAELVRRLTLFFQENGVAGVQRGKAVMPSMLDSSREEDPTSTEADTADERESHEDVEKSAEKLSRTRMEPTLNETFVTSAEEAEDGEQHPGNLTRVSEASVNLSLSRTPRARRRTSLLRASFLKEINMDSDGSLVQDEASTHKDRRRSSKMGRNSFMSENHDKAPTPKDRRRSSKLHRKSFMSEDEPKDEQEWMSEDDEDMEVDDAPQAVVAPAPPIQEPKPAMPPHPAAVQRSVSKGPMTAGSRFAKAHAKLEDNMENIKDYKERIKKRHEAHERNVPTVVQRLATPKSVASKRVTRRAAAAAAAASDSKKTGNAEGFRFTTMDIDQANFQFGRLSTSKIATIQKAPPKPSAIPTNIHRIARPVTRKEMDVKVRTMIRQPLKPTQEVASSSKSNVPMTVKKVEPKAVKRSYTPRLGRMEKFMDTTKLTDDQYAVVMDEGIVKPVGSAKRAHNTAMLREEDAVARKRRRDLLLAARRKLEI